jgi:REP element-mobilizing transposase RayT
MTQSYINIWIHAIWSTKGRMPMIHQNIESIIFQFISEQLREQGCPVRIVNGIPDHIHCLFLLSRQKSIAEIIKQVKGASSYYINDNKLTDEKFMWQTGYAAYSVSGSAMNNVFEYIKNQKQHHRNKTSKQEHDEFLRLNM